jgi:uncharacterized OB-fold protein
MFDPVVIVVGLLFLLPVVILLRGRQKDRIGTIRCNRCGYVGLTKGSWRLGRGFVPACGKCDGEDWVVVSE